MAQIMNPKRIKAVVLRAIHAIYTRTEKDLIMAEDNCTLHDGMAEILEALNFYSKLEVPDTLEELDKLMDRLPRDYFKFVFRHHRKDMRVAQDMKWLNQYSVALTSWLNGEVHRVPDEPQSPKQPSAGNAQKHKQPPVKETKKSHKKKSSKKSASESVSVASTPVTRSKLKKQAKTSQSIEYKSEILIAKQAEGFVNRWLEKFVLEEDLHAARQQTYSLLALAQKLKANHKSQAFQISAKEHYFRKMADIFNEALEGTQSDVESSSESFQESQDKAQNDKKEAEWGRGAGYQLLWNFIRAKGALPAKRSKSELAELTRDFSQDRREAYLKSYENQWQRMMKVKAKDPEGFAETLKSYKRKSK